MQKTLGAPDPLESVDLLDKSSNRFSKERAKETVAVLPQFRANGGLDLKGFVSKPE